MTLGALVSAGVPIRYLNEQLATLGLGVSLEEEKVLRGCFESTKVHVRTTETDPPQRHLCDITSIIDKSTVSRYSKQMAIRMFQSIGEAEAAAHGMNIEQVHFHEVGATDSIADIVGTSVGFEFLGIDSFSSRSVPTGSGFVKAAHGQMPIPAPATASLLQGIPLAASPIKSELTTPTGAAILKTYVTEWTETPAMTIEQIGMGAGTKDFAEIPNILRLFIGTKSEASSDVIMKLETNLDDVTPEVLGYSMEKLFTAGALDVYFTPIQMKKNRPGILVSVLCELAKADTLTSMLLQETGTLGIRKTQMSRVKQHREIITLQTAWGSVRVKKSWLHSSSTAQFSPEYEDISLIARTHNLAYKEVLRAVETLLRDRLC